MVSEVKRASTLKDGLFRPSDASSKSKPNLSPDIWDTLRSVRDGLSDFSKKTGNEYFSQANQDVSCLIKDALSLGDEKSTIPNEEKKYQTQTLVGK